MKDPWSRVPGPGRSPRRSHLEATNRKALELLTDAAFMLADIKKARQLPPFAQVQDQYIALGKRITEFLVTLKEEANGKDESEM